MEQEGFESFKARVRAFFGGEYPDELCIEALYEMVEGNAERYEFDMPHLRLSQDLLLAGILLSEWHGQHVVFLTATHYYAAQAMRMLNGYRAFGISCKTLSVGVAPMDALRDADVVLHHGRVYPLPADVHPKRTIVQIFPGETVPHDTRPLSALMCAAYADD